MQPSKQGFTLIELSIVLVIIGLIVGSVLVGRDLIKAAAIRATIKQVEQMDAAINTFMSKYNCLPGDCRIASNFGFTDADGSTGAAANGNGDGAINLHEDVNAMMQLKEALLLNVDSLTYGPSTIPVIFPKIRAVDSSGNKGYWLATYNNGLSVGLDGSGASTGFHNITRNAGHYYVLSHYFNNFASNIGVLIPVDAFTMDSKMDDGLPATGRVLATSAVNGIAYDAGSGATDSILLFDAGQDTGAAGAASNFCVTNAPYLYNVLNVSGGGASPCAMVVKASF